MVRLKSYNYILSILILAIVFKHTIANCQDTVSYMLGKNNFRTYCTSCHSSHQEIYGPMLASISKKKKEKWLIAFIKNSQSVIKSGDIYAKTLFEKFDNKVMPSFKQLSDNDIRSILYYLQDESKNPSEFINDSELSGNTDQSIIEGKLEFQEHCSMCHYIHKESDFAPSLGSVTKRHTREWLVSFIKNSQGKIKEGDPYATHLYNEFDNHKMTTMNFLSVDQINSILNYIAFASTIDATYKNTQNDSDLEISKNNKQILPQNISPTFTITFYTFILVILMIAMYLFYILSKTNK